MIKAIPMSDQKRERKRRPKQLPSDIAGTLPLSGKQIANRGRARRVLQAASAAYIGKGTYPKGKGKEEWGKAVKAAWAQELGHPGKQHKPPGTQALINKRKRAIARSLGAIVHGLAKHAENNTKLNKLDARVQDYRVYIPRERA